MRISVLALAGVVLVLAGCSSRAAPVADTGGLLDARPRNDGAPPPRDWGTPKTCTSLAKIGQTDLDYAGPKITPRIVFDGDRFAVVWHSQPAAVSSLNGDLRFALVDRKGTSATPDGIVLGHDDGAFQPALLAGAGEYQVLHRSRTTTGVSVSQLRRFDATGRTLSTVDFAEQMRLTAMAPHPAGVAVLFAEPGAPRIVVVDRSGAVSDGGMLPTAQVMASLWLAPSPTGFVAALHSTNSNADLHLLGPAFKQLGMTSVGHGALVRSVSFASTPGGIASLAAVYVSSAQVEVGLFDGSGTVIGNSTLAGAGAVGTGVDQTATVWSGAQLIAVYPGPVEGQHLISLLDERGQATGKAIQLPNCVGTAAGLVAAWGGDRLAVAAVNDASGLPSSSICVTVMGCP